jgi:hypothetical protein
MRQTAGATAVVTGRGRLLVLVEHDVDELPVALGAVGVLDGVVDIRFVGGFDEADVPLSRVRQRACFDIGRRDRSA